jgi:hypothetical protein
VETAAIIVTRYIGPTDHRPGRIRATSGSGKRLTVPWNHAAGILENHAAAAAALADRLRIAGSLVGGGLAGDGGGYAFAFIAR